MNNAYLSSGFVFLGLFGLAVVLLFQNISATDNQDYYLLKEIAEASMIDAFDLAKYRQTGEVKIFKEKFVESFVARWSESADRIRTYTIEIYDVQEDPPKISLKVTSKSETFMFDMGSKKSDAKQTFDIVGSIDSILETKY